MDGVAFRIQGIPRDADALSAPIDRCNPPSPTPRAFGDYLDELASGRTELGKLATAASNYIACAPFGTGDTEPLAPTKGPLGLRSEIRYWCCGVGRSLGPCGAVGRATPTTMMRASGKPRRGHALALTSTLQPVACQVPL